MFFCPESLNKISASAIIENYVDSTSDKEKELIAHL